MGKKILIFLEYIKRGILEVLYPRSSRCIVCREDTDYRLCTTCRSKIVKSKETELYIGYYKGPLKELILKFKYKKNFEAGDVIVDLLEDKLKGYNSNYYFTYIPISDESKKVRQFNQCEYIAKELAFRENKIAINTLKKVRETRVQKTLSKEERYKNLRGAFEIVNKDFIYGKSFILIDDVFTTGATLTEGIRVLKENGANKIKILFVAKSSI